MNQQRRFGSVFIPFDHFHDSFLLSGCYAQPSLLVFMYLNMRKASLFQQFFQLRIPVDGHAVYDLRPLVIPVRIPAAFVADQERAAGFRTRCTSRKQETGSGQKYTVSKAVTASKQPFGNSIRSTLPSAPHNFPLGSPRRYACVLFPH